MREFVMSWVAYTKALFSMWKLFACLFMVWYVFHGLA
jgi:hypothetical protein